MRKPFRVVVADPPWAFADALPGPSRGARKNYTCMVPEALQAFPLPPLADDATLFLWRVASMQAEALAVAKAWGFVVKSELVWLKTTATGKRWFGMGRTVRMEHEVCLIAHRGKPKTLRHDIRSTFTAVNERHSQKPEAFYGVVEALRAGPYCELFARRRRPGWTCFGDEVEAG